MQIVKKKKGEGGVASVLTNQKCNFNANPPNICHITRADTLALMVFLKSSTMTILVFFMITIIYKKWVFFRSINLVIKLFTEKIDFKGWY